MHDTSDDTVAHELPKLLGEHLLRHIRNRAFEIGEPQRLAAKEVKEDQKFPAAVEHADRVLDTRGGGFGSVPLLTHR